MNILSQCKSMQASFSAYLDGAVSGHKMQQISKHLDSCTSCAKEFAAWRTTQDALAMLRTAKAPKDLGLKLRLAISRESSKRTSSIFDTLSVRWENAVRPLLIQVSAGFASAVVLLCIVGFLLGAVTPPTAVLAYDEPLGAITAPRYLYSVEHPHPITMSQDATIVVEAEVNDRGRIYDYKILSGPGDPAVRTQLEDRLLQSVFEPAHVFGAPVRGWVVLTYAGTSDRS